MRAAIQCMQDKKTGAMEQMRIPGTAKIDRILFAKLAAQDMLPLSNAPTEM